MKINNNVNRAWKQHKSTYFGEAPKHLTKKKQRWIYKAWDSTITITITITREI